MKVVAFSGALRKDSYNLQLIKAVAPYFKSLGHEIEMVELKSLEIPVYDGDIETSAGIPNGVKILGEKITQSDALYVSTPEYNAGIPGSLKNAIDWLSRLKPNPLSGKPLLLTAASPGALGGVRSLWHTRVPFEELKVQVFAEMFGLSKAHEAFENGSLKDPKTKERIETLIKSFCRFAEKISN